MDALNPKSDLGQKARAGRRRLVAPIAMHHAFDFVPAELRAQCQRLIVTFHEMHGYACLPDMLWKAGLGGFIERHSLLRDALQKASTARSARRANEFFVIIAVEILALEVLARDYAQWSNISVAFKNRALELLGGNSPSGKTWLIEHYLYPPRLDTSVKLSLQPGPQVGGSRVPDRALTEAVAFDASVSLAVEKMLPLDPAE